MLEGTVSEPSNSFIGFRYRIDQIFAFSFLGSGWEGVISRIMKTNKIHTRRSLPNSRGPKVERKWKNKVAHFLRIVQEGNATHF